MVENPFCKLQIMVANTCSLGKVVIATRKGTTSMLYPLDRNNSVTGEAGFEPRSPIFRSRALADLRDQYYPGM